ncbi:MAG: DUF2278 family protein [Acidimicrobiales bacterium]
MPLDRYGVLVGTLTAHFRDTPDDQGRWFHVNLRVRAEGADYRAAVDVDSHQSAVGVEWKVVDGLTASDLGPVSDLDEGYHDLTMTSTSGAVDYTRSRWMQSRPGCVFVAMPDPVLAFLSRLFGPRVPPWSQGSNLDAAQAFEPLLAGSPKVLIFGEPFTTGLGMHNVHQNQGDPAGSQWWAENGIWQDGATLLQRPTGRWSAFVSKFTSQSYRTDGQGHPV